MLLSGWCLFSSIHALHFQSVVFACYSLCCNLFSMVDLPLLVQFHFSFLPHLPYFLLNFSIKLPCSGKDPSKTRAFMCAGCRARHVRAFCVFICSFARCCGARMRAQRITLPARAFFARATHLCLLVYGAARAHNARARARALNAPYYERRITSLPAYALSPADIWTLLSYLPTNYGIWYGVAAT